VSWGKKLPPILLLHGNADVCAPIDNAERFADALQEGGAAVQLKTYNGQTHTSPLIENPMRGGRDLLQDDILAAVTDQAEVFTNQMPLCPELLIRAAAFVCPF
jgi:prenylcysteine alpha-carboxyl methylesterase